MKQIIFRRKARLDALDAYRWYQKQQPGLGVDFRHELDATLHRIGEHPKAYSVLERDTRRALMRRFPYSVFFREYEDTVVIIAVFHTHRDPNTWNRRIR